MKFAMVNQSRLEARPGLSGECPSCSRLMVPKCGEVKVWHWAHAGSQACDHWWENETQWHRRWKGHFPTSWQEIIHHAEDGEKHIADVKTDKGWVLEFQHSFLNPEERRARNGFYQKFVWVVDGTRRKKDIPQFQKSFEDGTLIAEYPPIHKIYADECGILNEWANDRVPVLLDFGEPYPLWCLFPTAPGGALFVSKITRNVFVGFHIGITTDGGDGFEEYLKDCAKLVSEYLSRPHAHVSRPAPSFPRGRRPLPRKPRHISRFRKRL